jgi:hypothetical protein
MHQNAALLSPIHTVALRPESDTGAFYMYMLVDPNTEVVTYQPFIPYGQSQMFVTELSAGDAHVYDQLEIWLDGDAWFRAYPGTATTTSAMNGITCRVSDFGPASVAVTIENRNDTVAPVRVRLVATIEKDGVRRPGPDPQIVMPPEKPTLPAGAVRPGA